MQQELDHYDSQRSHHGRGMNGRAVIAFFKSGIPKPSKDRKEKPMNNAA